MTTIHDVAKKAGVAPITVSRVVNNSGYVSNALRAKIQDAIDELGYVPNVIARSLKSKKTNTLALVFTDITNPFFNILARGVEDAASDAGYNVIFCNTDESQIHEDKYIQLLLEKQVDGILLVPADSESHSVDRIRKQDTPLVIIDRCVSASEVDVVRGDSEGGAFLLTEHLIKLGHRRITLLSGPEKVSTSVDRVRGYERAMKEHGLSDDIHYYYGEYSQESGAAITRDIFSGDLTPPTAIFGGNNVITIGALSVLRSLGLRVPDDVAMVSFDDIPASLTFIPFMTVVSQPPYEMGEKATELLLKQIERKPDQPYEPQEIVFPVQLVIRESSGNELTSN